MGSSASTAVRRMTEVPVERERGLQPRDCQPFPSLGCRPMGLGVFPGPTSPWSGGRKGRRVSWGAHMGTEWWQGGGPAGSALQGADRTGGSRRWAREGGVHARGHEEKPGGVRGCFFPPLEGWKQGKGKVPPKGWASQLFFPWTSGSAYLTGRSGPWALARDPGLRGGEGSPFLAPPGGLG